MYLKVPSNAKSLEEIIDYSKIANFNEFMDLATTVGSRGRVLTDNLRGINHMGVNMGLPKDKNGKGMVFFTRPQLNLTDGNIRNIRQFYSLLTQNPLSVHRWVRCTLDPRLMLPKSDKWLRIDGKTAGTPTPLDYQKSKGTTGEIVILLDTQLECPLVDNTCGFIPALTNTITKLSGWPDIVIDKWVSKGGMRKQEWFMIDGQTEIYNTFDLSATFLNPQESPLFHLFRFWEMYMPLVREGMLNPYIDFIAENEIDYNTRIYRLILDETQRFVKKISNVGAAVPFTLPTGSVFDYDNSKPYMVDGDLSIQFSCVGAEYNDDISLYEFNQVSAIFNPQVDNMYSVDPKNRLFFKSRDYGNPDTSMVKIPRVFLPMFKNKGIPLIDPLTLELDWYIDMESKTYKRVLELVKAIYKEDAGKPTAGTTEANAGNKLKAAIEKAAGKALGQPPKAAPLPMGAEGSAQTKEISGDGNVFPTKAAPMALDIFELKGLSSFELRRKLSVYSSNEIAKHYMFGTVDENEDWADDMSTQLINGSKTWNKLSSKEKRTFRVFGDGMYEDLMLNGIIPSNEVEL